MEARGGSALVALVIVLAAPMGSAAWTQAGGGPARAYASADEGPLRDEVSLVLSLPMPRVPGRPLLIAGGAAHMLLEPTSDTVALGPSSASPRSAIIYRVDLATGEGSEVAHVAGPVHGWAMDEERYYLALASRIDALGLDGKLAWTWAVEGNALTARGQGACIEPVVGDGVLFSACTASFAFVPANPRSHMYDERFMIALDATDGSEIWLKEFGDENNGATTGLLLARGQLVTTEVRQSLDYHAHVMGFDPATGNCLWFVRHHWEPAADSADPERTLADAQRAATMTLAAIANEREVLVKFGDLRGHPWPLGELACDDASQTTADSWTATSPIAPLGRATLAHDGERTYVAEGRYLGVIDGVERIVHDVYELPPAMEWAPGSVIATPSRLYAFALSSPTTLDPPYARLHALAADENDSWVREFDSYILDPPGLADGLIVYTAAQDEMEGATRSRPTQLYAIGRGPASIQPSVSWPDDFPPVGAPLVIDVTGTGSGALADDVQVNVDWGDGATSAFALDERAIDEHTYDAAGDQLVRITFTNSQGQSSIEERVLHVGGAAPDSSTFLARQFDAQNQERTFFILGLLATAIFAAFGIMRVRRKRNRLTRELAAIEKVYALTHARPAECERALVERRSHVRGLLVDGSVDENQFGVLERRIDELARQVRLDTIDEQLGFLPISMGRSLKALLADGKIERWERAHFMEILEGDVHLTSDQKLRVKALIERWLAADQEVAHATGASSIVRP